MIPFIILYCSAERENELFFVISQAREEELNSKFRREFDEFYSCVSKQLWIVLYKKFKNYIPPYRKDDINDAYQQGWYNIVKKRSAFKQEKSLKVFNWLSTVMINEAKNFLKFPPTPIDPPPEPPLIDNGSQITLRDNIEEINYIIRTEFSDIEKLVYKKRIIDEMKYQDIADELGFAIGTVYNHYNNGINKIKKQIKLLNK